MKMNWDSYERDYIFDHGGFIDESGIAHFTKETARRLPLGDSIRHPGLKSLMIPSIAGCCLIFEKMHFVID